MKFLTETRNCPVCNNSTKSLYLVEDTFNIVKCKGCGFIYLDNLPDEPGIYEDYYDNKITKEDYTKFSNNKMLSEIYTINEQRMYYIRKFKLKGNLLDIGCGSGLFVKTALTYGFDVYGIDVSASAINIARDEFNLKADAKNISEMNDSHMKFDVITMWHVLEHVIDPVKELKFIKKLLKKDGLLLVEVPNMKNVKFTLTDKKWKGGNHPMYYKSFFTAKTLKLVLNKAGFLKTKRVMISYELPGRNFLYNKTKEIFNIFALDAFLDYAAINK